MEGLWPGPFPPLPRGRQNTTVAVSKPKAAWTQAGPPTSLCLSSDLCNGKTLSACSLLGLLTHQAQLGLPPATWHGDRLAPMLAFPMTPFKIHHVPRLGPSINNTPSSQGLPAHRECQVLGIRIWPGPALGARTPQLQHPGSLGSRCPFPHCPPLGSCGRCPAQPQAVGPGVLEAMGIIWGPRSSRAP